MVQSESPTSTMATHTTGIISSTTAPSEPPDDTTGDNNPPDGTLPDVKQDDDDKEDADEDDQPLAGELDDGNKNEERPLDGSPDDGNPDDGSILDSETLDGEAPEEQQNNFINDNLFKLFQLCDLTAKYLFAGEKPQEDMLVTQEDIDRDYKEKEDVPAWDTQKVFYFSCRPYRPSAFVAYVDSPWLREQLKPITFDEMTLETHHRGRSIRLTNMGYSRYTFGWMHCGVKDSTGTTGRIVLHNMRADRPVDTVLPHFAEFIVKEPYYTIHCDGKVTIRVDHPSDLIISSPYTVGMVGDGGLLKYPSKEVSTEDRCELSFKLLGKGYALFPKNDFRRADLWFRDAAWIAAETEGPRAETLYCVCQFLRASVGLFSEHGDLVYLRATAANGRNLGQAQAACCAFRRGDFRTAARHVTELVKTGDLEAARMVRDDMKLDCREREIRFGVYAEEDFGSGSTRDRSGKWDFKHASFLEKVWLDKDRMCLRAARPTRKGIMISAESLFQQIQLPESVEMERVKRFGQDEARKMVGAHAALVSVVLDTCTRCFVSTRERTSLFDEIPRDCTNQEPYDVFHIQEVINRHAIKWKTNPKDPAKSVQGAAIWPTSAYIRGSDDPNAKGRIVNDMLFLYAIREIKEGEVITMREITINDHSFRYKPEENYKGGDLEPFLPPREGEPPPPIIDPGARLFHRSRSQLDVIRTTDEITERLTEKLNKAKRGRELDINALLSTMNERADTILKVGKNREQAGEILGQIIREQPNNSLLKQLAGRSGNSPR